MKNYKILANLGTGFLVIDNKNEIPTVGSLVNHKSGKHKRKGTPITFPLEVVGIDIGYRESNSTGGHKYVLVLVLVLVLVDKCTSNTFVYSMHNTSGADVVQALWKFLSMLVNSLTPSNAILILDLLVEKRYHSFNLTAVMYVLPQLTNKIIMAWSKNDRKF